MTNYDIVKLVHDQAEQGALAAQIAQQLVRSYACLLECWRIPSRLQAGRGRLACLACAAGGRFPADHVLGCLSP